MLTHVLECRLILLVLDLQVMNKLVSLVQAVLQFSVVLENRFEFDILLLQQLFDLVEFVGPDLADLVHLLQLLYLFLDDDFIIEFVVE